MGEAFQVGHLTRWRDETLAHFLFRVAKEAGAWDPRVPPPDATDAPAREPGEDDD